MHVLLAVCIAHYLRDARAAFPSDDKRAISEAFRCFEHVRVKHCTDIQVRPSFTLISLLVTASHFS